MNSAEAKAIVKGKTPDCSRDEITAAWQLLVDTGEIWDMTIRESRLAACMIEAGTIERNAA